MGRRQTSRGRPSPGGGGGRERRAVPRRGEPAGPPLLRRFASLGRQHQRLTGPGRPRPQPEEAARRRAPAAAGGCRGTGKLRCEAEMADEALFLLLHNEMVAGLYRAAEQGEGVSGAGAALGAARQRPGLTLRRRLVSRILQENGRCTTKLESMGFRVGQGLIER